MIINLYTNTSDSRYARKTLSVKAANIQARPTAEMSIVSPIIELDYVSSYLTANYAYISDFGKYYYITNIRVKSGSVIIMELDADDRMNWYDFYKNKSATVLRSESVGAPTEIPDSKLPIDQNRHDIKSIKFLVDGGTPFATDIKECAFVLTVIGNNKQNPQIS